LTWAPTEPVISVGQSFWYQKADTSVNDLWIQEFTAVPYSDSGTVCLGITQAPAGSFTMSINGAPGANTYYIMSKPTLGGLYWSYETSVLGNSSATILANGRTSLFLVAVNSLGDSDGDGIPDWWLMQYFGHPTGMASDKSRAQDDANGDGLSNRQKFVNRSNPRYLG